jgi:16S rRNA (cytidine1402-2'-O)-methyltransferase
VKKGKLILIPNHLGDMGPGIAFPPSSKEAIGPIQYYIVESSKPARRLLKSLDPGLMLEEISFRLFSELNDTDLLAEIGKTWNSGELIGLISDAGCPAVADPGAVVVSMAHRQGVEVVPLVGPSSFLLALMASGLNGQKFSFEGYLPKERISRIEALKNMDFQISRSDQTYIFMDTPYRNAHLFQDILENVRLSLRLCIALDLHTSRQEIRTLKLSEWQEQKTELIFRGKRQAVFLIGR